MVLSWVDGFIIHECNKSGLKFTCSLGSVTERRLHLSFILTTKLSENDKVECIRGKMDTVLTKHTLPLSQRLQSEEAWTLKKCFWRTGVDFKELRKRLALCDQRASEWHKGRYLVPSLCHSKEKKKHTLKKQTFDIFPVQLRWVIYLSNCIVSCPLPSPHVHGNKDHGYLHY